MLALAALVDVSAHRRRAAVADILDCAALAGQDAAVVSAQVGCAMLAENVANRSHGR
jgi:hypothetical protein